MGGLCHISLELAQAACGTPRPADTKNQHNQCATSCYKCCRSTNAKGLGHKTRRCAPTPNVANKKKPEGALRRPCCNNSSADLRISNSGVHCHNPKVRSNVLQQQQCLSLTHISIYCTACAYPTQLPYSQRCWQYRVFTDNRHAPSHSCRSADMYRSADMLWI